MCAFSNKNKHVNLCNEVAGDSVTDHVPHRSVGASTDQNSANILDQTAGHRVVKRRPSHLCKGRVILVSLHLRAHTLSGVLTDLGLASIKVLIISRLAKRTAMCRACLPCSLLPMTRVGSALTRGHTPSG